MGAIPRTVLVVMTAALFVPDEAGRIPVGNESVSSLEVEEAMRDIFSRIGEPGFLDNWFDNWVEILKQYREPVQKVIYYVFDKILYHY